LCVAHAGQWQSCSPTQKSVWIGGRRVAHRSSQIVWNLGNRNTLPLDFTHWDPKQPDNHYGREDCMELYRQYTWNDYECLKGLCFLCELP